MSWETVNTSCHASHVVIKRAASSFHIVELALLDTCDQSLDADVFLGVLVQNMVGWGSEVMLQTFFLPV